VWLVILTLFLLIVILLCHVAYMECNDAACCYRSSVVCVSACRDTTMSCAKTAEPIKVLFQVLTQMEPCGGPDPPVKGHFGGHLSAHCRLSIGNIRCAVNIST